MSVALRIVVASLTLLPLTSCTSTRDSVPAQEAPQETSHEAPRTTQTQQVSEPLVQKEPAQAAQQAAPQAAPSSAPQVAQQVAEPSAQQAAPIAAKQPKKAAAPVYDEQADARADLHAALARAKKENRRVLIQWGANWCHWCVLLHGKMRQDAKLAKELMYEYDVVRVDMGQGTGSGWSKNADLAKELGAKIEGIPYLTVLDADGKPIAQNDTTAFETNENGKAGHDAQKVLAFLTENQAPALEAAKVREAALARAKSENKLVFLHFGAPWCGWCHKLEGWMERKEVAPLLAKAFVDLKIDTDRAVGGADMLRTERQAAGVTEDGGIPWFVFLDGNGTQVANSQGPKGNTGFPYQDDEIAHFVAMLEKARPKLSDADIQALRESLTSVRKEDEARKASKSAATDSTAH